MNDSNRISSLLHALLFGSALLVGQRVALAQDAAPAKADPASPVPPVVGAVPPAAGDTAPGDAAGPPPPVPGPEAAPSEPPPPPPVTEPPAPPESKKPAKDRLRFEIGGRVGYAVPYGNLATSSKLKDVFSGTVPGQLDGWLRFPGGLALGLYFGLAAGISGHALDACPNCSALNYRFGLQAARHFNDGGIVDPWLGIGVGWEWASISEQEQIQGYDVTYDNTYTALPELTAQAGIDIGSDTIAFGPFVSVSYASYSKLTSKISCSNIGCDDGVSSDSDVDGGGHGWLTLGIRGTYMR
jgi:hypothetical protein